MLVCAGSELTLQFTHVTVVPGLIRTWAGVNWKLRIITSVDPNALEGIGDVQTFVSVAGPAARSEKHATEFNVSVEDASRICSRFPLTWQPP